MGRVKETDQQVTQAWPAPAEKKYWAAPYYSQYSNTGSATVRGIEITGLFGRYGPFRSGFHYAWTKGQGTGSTPIAYQAHGPWGAGVEENVSLPTGPLYYVPKHQGYIYFELFLTSSELFSGLGVTWATTFASGHRYTHLDGGFGGRNQVLESRP